MALPSQIERNSSMNRGGATRGSTSTLTSKLLIVGGVLLLAGATFGVYKLWPSSSAPSAANEPVNPSPTALKDPPAVTKSPSSTAAPAPVNIVQGTTATRPANSLGEAFAQGAPAVNKPPTTPPAAVGQALPGQVTPSAGTFGTNTPNPGESSKLLASGAPPQSSVAVPAGAVATSFIEAADRALAASKPLEARVALSRALASPDGVKAEKDLLRQRLSTLNEDLVFSAKVTSGDPLTELYTVVSGDALEKIRRKRELTPEWMLIQRVNRMESADSLKIGQKLKLVRGPFHAVVTKADFRVDIFAGSPEEQDSWIYIRSFTAGLGADNGTPVGTFVVRNKMQNPEWRNPRTGEKFERDDPKNPIGEFWIGLQGLGDSAPITGYGLHGTIEPASIGSQKSMGCVRLLDADIKLIYELLTPKISMVKIVP